MTVRKNKWEQKAFTAKKVRNFGNLILWISLIFILKASCLFHTFIVVYHSVRILYDVYGLYYHNIWNPISQHCVFVHIVTILISKSNKKYTMKVFFSIIEYRSLRPQEMYESHTYIVKHVQMSEFNKCSHRGNCATSVWTYFFFITWNIYFHIVRCSQHRQFLRTYVNLFFPSIVNYTASQHIRCNSWLLSLCPVYFWASLGFSVQFSFKQCQIVLDWH